jgi:hypothetical protein
MTKLDLTKPMQTVSGLPYELFCSDYKIDGEDICLVGRVTNQDGKQKVIYNKPDGSNIYLWYPEYALINIPKKVKLYFNQYRNSNGEFTYVSLGRTGNEESVENCHAEYQKTIEVEVEE